jgi:type IV pilus assembly protein PilO
MPMGLRTFAYRQFHITSAGLVNKLNGLDLRRPEMWPVVLQRCCFISAGFLVWLAIAFIFIGNLKTELQNLQTERQLLEKQTKTKREKVALLEPLSAETEALEAQMKMVSGQLPANAHWDVLLSELNQAGRRHKLELEWVKPDPPRVTSQWVELPASIRVKGSFHSMGRFVSELAHFNRLVALGQLSFEASANDTVILQAKLKAFRQRSPAEAAAFKEKKSAVAVLAALTLAPTDYEGSGRPDPFGPHAIQVTSKMSNSPSQPSKPVASHTKHPLEVAPLDAMRLVGQLLQGDRSIGLIRLKSAVYPVRVGTVLGTNQGQVSSVDSSGLVVLEKSTDASGHPSQRSTFMPMNGSTP